jgi:TolB-like protein/thioredoxin-like negative regulator of GroEL
MSLFSELKRRNVIRVAFAYFAAAWLITEVAGTVLPAFGYGDAELRVIIILLAIAIVPTLVFSWIFEITPEGVKREVDVDREQSITRFTGKKIDRAIMILLAFGVVYFAFDKFVLDPVEDAQIAEVAHEEGRSAVITESFGERSIAVLPFVNLSDDPEQEYFSDGIAEELLNQLAKIPQLRVISRSSAFSFKGKELNVSKIAETLDVAHVLEGSVRKSGNRVRITAKLIEARTDTNLWSEIYERELDDIFAIQNDVAKQVTAQLKVNLIEPESPPHKVNPDAFLLYLQARHLFNQFTKNAWEESERLLETALQIDPDFVSARVQLGDLHAWFGAWGIRPFEESIQNALDAAAQVLATEPDNVEALALLALCKAGANREFKSAAILLQRSLNLEPTNRYAIEKELYFLQMLGQIDAAVSVTKYLMVNDPVNANLYSVLAECYLWTGHLENAIKNYESALMFSTQMMGVHRGIAKALLMKGEPQQALDLLRNSPKGVDLSSAVKIYHALGDQYASDVALSELIETRGRSAAYNIAATLAFRNETDRAFEWLEKAVQFNDPGLLNILNEPDFNNLHNDPRWPPFLESIGFSPRQIDAVRFRVNLPD